MLNAIINLAIPKNITDAMSWFRPVNQVAWTYFLSPVMSHFQALKKCPLFVGPCFLMGEVRGDVGTRENYLLCSRFHEYKEPAAFLRKTNKMATSGD